MENTIMHELDENEICEVSGGHPIVVGIAAVATVATACLAISAFGEKCGKAFYNLLH